MRRKISRSENEDFRTREREESDLSWDNDAHQELWSTRVKVHELIRKRAVRLARERPADWRGRYIVTLQDFDQARREIFKELAENPELLSQG